MLWTKRFNQNLNVWSPTASISSRTTTRFYLPFFTPILSIMLCSRIKMDSTVYLLTPFPIFADFLSHLYIFSCLAINSIALEIYKTEPLSRFLKAKFVWNIFWYLQIFLRGPWKMACCCKMFWIFFSFTLCKFEKVKRFLIATKLHKKTCCAFIVWKALTTICSALHVFSIFSVHVEKIGSSLCHKSTWYRAMRLPAYR